MKLVLISDTHQQHSKLKLPKGDVLIHAGDFLGWGTQLELYGFAYWLAQEARKFEHVIVVAGNHDGVLQRQPTEAIATLYQIPNLYYLMDSEIVLNGVKFWGSPWTTEFKKWYFMRPSGPAMDKVWRLIPDDTQVLITHSPPTGILDKGLWGTAVGCDMLAHRLGPEGNLRPRLHVFGHAHSSYGQVERIVGEKKILHANAALTDDANQLSRKPIALELSFD